MHLCVLCYCDACLESSALRVGVKILLSLIPIVVLLTSKMQVWTFWYILLLYESLLFGAILDNLLKTE